MPRGSRSGREVCRRGLLRAVDDGAPKSAKVEQRIASNKVKVRQRSRRGKIEADDIWGIEGVELPESEVGDEGDELNVGGDSTNDSADSTAHHVDADGEEDALPHPLTTFIQENNFNRFGRLAQTSPAASRLPQELIDKIVEFNVPDALETYRRWSKGGYRLHIVNTEDFRDTGTMICMKPFHTETLRQISRKVTIYVDISEPKAERAQAWGRMPPSLPEHITSRIQRFEFREVQLLDFRPVIPHTIPAWNEIENVNRGESAKHFNRFSGIFERQPDYPDILKVVKIRREMNTALFIPEQGTPQQVNDFIMYLLRWRGPLMVKQLPNYVPRPKSGDKDADQKVWDSKRYQRQRNKMLKMPGGTLEELLEKYGMYGDDPVDWIMPGIGRVFEPLHQEVVEIAEQLEGKGWWVEDERWP